MLTCKEVTKLVSESLDRKLPLRQRVALTVHFMICRFCRRFRDDLQHIRNQIGQEAGDMDNSDEKLSDVARDRIKSLLDSET